MVFEPEPGSAGPKLLDSDAMSFQTRPRPRGLPAGGIAVCVAAVLMILVAGCGGPAPHPPAGRASGMGGFGSMGGTSRARVPAGVGSGSTLGGALFGGNNALVSQEGALGRTLAIVRTYYRIGQAFPGPSDRALMKDGSTLLVSLDTVPGQGPSYASIIAGNQDAAIIAFLKEVNQAAVRYHLGAIYISFEHEADIWKHLILGPPWQFDRAWDHIHHLAATAHLNWNDGGRLHWVLILTHRTYATTASRFWPGVREVDIVATDGYNSRACRAGKYSPWLVGNPTPADLFDPAVRFASIYGLPVFIAEWGSDSSPPGAQSEFIHEMQAYVADTPQIVATMYWDSGIHCNYRIDGHPASVAALAAMGHSALMQGHVLSTR